MTFEIPHIRVRAQYRSSGVLILVKASGAGDYWGEYGIQSWFEVISSENFTHFGFHNSKIDGVRAKIYFKAVPVDQQDGLTYLRVEEAKMDFSVKSIQMGVDNVAGGNSVIRMYPSQFISSNGNLLIPGSLNVCLLQFQRRHWICSSTATPKSYSKKWSQRYVINSPQLCIRSLTDCSSAFQWNTS